MTRRLGFSVCALAVLATQALAQMTAAPQTAPPGTVPPPYASNATSSTDLVSEVPCDRVRHNPDGSWTFPGTVTMAGGAVDMTNTTFKGSKEGMTLDARCGAQEKQHN
jgi:hypothetical protein